MLESFGNTHGPEHNTHDREIIKIELILLTCWKFFIVLRAISGWPLELELTDLELWNKHKYIHVSRQETVLIRCHKRAVKGSLLIDHFYASNFGEEDFREWVLDEKRQEAKTETIFKITGRWCPIDQYMFCSGTKASAMGQVKHLLLQNWRSASGFWGSECEPSQNKQPGVLDPTKLCSRW